MDKGEGTNQAETTAEAVVRAFEDVAIDTDKTASTRVYSPYKDWTNDIRTENSISDSKFTNICKAYYAVRGRLLLSDPSTCTKGLKKLVSDAGAASDKKWYERAVEVYNEKPWLN